MELATLHPDGTLRFAFHAGQMAVMRSAKRFVLALAGTQSGKTCAGPPWLYREIQTHGPGDYLVVAPTFQLLAKKALPEFLGLFQTTLRLGEYRVSDHIFYFHDRKTKVYFGYAENPDSLESATAKAAWLDEAGQAAFKLGSWEAILRRLSVHQGRCLVTTTPYNSTTWLKSQLYDPWMAAKRNHPVIEVVQFKSVANPFFPRAEFERARDTMPAWKFRLFYEAEFSRPAGAIYDCFDDAVHRVPRFAIPDHWPRHLGLDFGGVNTAGVFLAEEMAEHCHNPQPRFAPPNRHADWRPTGKLYVYREYKAGGRTAKEHVIELLQGEPKRPNVAGGSQSEGQWRSEFAAAGLAVREPLVSEVEVGIDRVYGAIKRGELFVFEDLAGLLGDLGGYSRELDDAGEPTEKIADKASYHFADALRYIVQHLKGERRRLNMGV